MRLVYPWLCDLVRVPGDLDTVAREISLRGFEVASVEHGRVPVIDFEITANRPDCLSHMGLAREAATIWGLPLQAPDTHVPEPGPSLPLTVHVADADLCPRYCAQVFEVRIGPSPAWMQDRLEAAGVRPISNIVDVTNYVMLELGQPMHAFDLSHIRGGTLVIRRARAGERLQTLDGVDRALEPEMLVIADAQRALAVGGVMGGQDSEVSAGTTLIALESAYFHPASIRRTSKRLGLKTEASSRFERGADIEAAPAGIARAAALLRQIEAGRPMGSPIDCYPSPRVRREILLRASRIAHLLGQPVPAGDVVRILEPLGFEILGGAPGAEAGWRVGIPSYRVDVLREVDLIEEVGRHYGFDRLPVSFPALDAPQAPPDPRIGRDALVRQVLTTAGFSEAMTFAFIERQAALPFCAPGHEPHAVANPLSEKFAVLRPSLLPGLVDGCSHNRRRGRKDVRLFETGSRFAASGEQRAVACAWSGAAAGPHWSASPRGVDFFDIKGVVELLCSAFGLGDLSFESTTTPWLVAGRSAEAKVGATSIGLLGQLAPDVAEARGLPRAEEVYVAEIDTERLAELSTRDTLRAATLPRFPSIVRDVSILVDEALPAAAVRGTIRAAAPPTLVSAVEFDRYRGKGIPEGRVSLSVRLTYRALDRTLTDDEADAATGRIVEALCESHGAERR